MDDLVDVVVFLASSAVIDHRNSLYVGHLGPIPFYVHWTALILVYMVWMWSGGDTSLHGMVMLLFVLVSGIVLHELGHGFASLLLARRESEKSLMIVLWAFGGVCISQSREGRPWKELIIVLAGPAVSLALAVGGAVTFVSLSATQPALLGLEPYETVDVWHYFLSLSSYRSPSGLSLLGDLLWTTMMVNKSLLIFNMLPIYPFDGGQAVLNVFKMTLRDYDLSRNLAFGLSVIVAAAYLAWQFSLSGSPPIQSALLIGFMLYQGYIALFIYRH